MSTLIVQLPAQPRLSAQHPAAPAPGGRAELAWVLSADGLQAGSSGRAPLAQLPKAQSTWAVLSPADVAWQPMVAPKAPPARLRAALAGLLEESLLDDEAELQLAVSPGWKAGEPGWVAVTGKAWLRSQIDALEAAGHSVDRVLPGWAPDAAPAAHLYRPEPDAGAMLAWRDAQGPLCLPLAGEGARGLLASLPADLAVDWSASPDCADEAARLAGRTVAARSEAEQLLAAGRSDWNLRQFDLAPQHRGSRMARELFKRFLHDRAWRPVRLGVLALLLVQLAGLNAWAWQQQRALKAQKSAMTALLQSTFPNVRAVIDAPAQMQKEIDLLRAAAGHPGETDLEPLLAAAEAAWPPSRGPAESIKFEPGRLTLGSPGWTPQEIAGFRARLRPLGLDAEAAAGRVVLSKLAPGAAPLPQATGTAPPGPPLGAQPAGLQPGAQPPGPGAGPAVPPPAVPVAPEPSRLPTPGMGQAGGATHAGDAE